MIIERLALLRKKWGLPPFVVHAAALPPFPLRIEIRFQCDSVVVFGIASAVEKGDVLFARRVQQWLPPIGMSIQFLCVSALKLRPFLRIVREPFA